jgi:hypothetical protein
MIALAEAKPIVRSRTAALARLRTQRYKYNTGTSPYPAASLWMTGINHNPTTLPE